jgi:hypothetical protein
MYSFIIFPLETSSGHPLRPFSYITSEAIQRQESLLQWTVAASPISYPVSVRGVSVAHSLKMARSVTVQLLKIDGSPITGVILPFEQMSGSYTPQTQQPPDIKLSAPTDSQGSTSVLLWENATGTLPNYFRLTLPGSGEPLDFTVPAGVGSVPLVSRLDPPGSGTQSTRVVTMHQDHSDGTPWAGGVVTVTLESFCYTSLAIYPAGSIKITLDANGEASQPLIANGGATNASRIRWDLPNGDTFWVQIPAGNTPITLSALRALAEVPLPPSVPPTYQSPPTVPLSAVQGVVDAAVSAHNLDTAAHPNGIAGGGAGGSIDDFELVALAGYPAHFKEAIKPGGVLSTVVFWDGSGKSIKLMTKTINRTSGKPSSVVRVNERTGAILTTTIATISPTLDTYTGVLS